MSERTEDYVLDASALVLALVGKDAVADEFRRRLPGMRRHAPHLIDAELGNVLRRHESARLISAAEAETALNAGRVLVQHRYPHAGALAQLAWSWRANLTFYDALYVALALRLNAPLISANGRLARAPNLACRLEVL